MSAPVMSSEELPEYSAQPGRSGPPCPSTDQARSSRCEHSYSLENKGHKWITLRVNNSRAPSPKQLPAFFDGDVVEGVVEMDLPKAESVKGVTITVVAGTTTVGQEEMPFLSMTKDLWTPNAGLKLKGTHSWPFSIQLPRTVEAANEEKGPKSTYPMPPTWAERASPAYIDYRLVATVKRGLMRVNQTLTTSFVYLPRSFPDPPSELRQLAYRENHALIEPKGDPGGWKVLPPITLRGTLFESREVEVTYKFALATPLSYAAGSPIPLVCTLTCADAQALDLLSKPSALGLCLVRMLAIGSHALDVEHVPVVRSNNRFLDVVARAAWWPSEHRHSGPHVRELEGEVDVRKGIKPSFVFPRISLGYSIVLLPPSAPGFVSNATPAEPLLTERVRITTGNAPGVSPRSHAPPGYVHEQQGDYMLSVGLLENGNQRFLGHHGHFGT